MRCCRHKLIFLIPISLLPDVVDLRYFKLWILLDVSQNMSIFKLVKHTMIISSDPIFKEGQTRFWCATKEKFCVLFHKTFSNGNPSSDSVYAVHSEKSKATDFLNSVKFKLSPLGPYQPLCISRHDSSADLNIQSHWQKNLSKSPYNFHFKDFISQFFLFLRREQPSLLIPWENK